MSVFTYDPSKVALYIAGYRITGITSVEATWNTPAFREIRGIRGKNTRVQNKNTSGEIIVEIQQTSISNDILNSIVTQDIEIGTGRLEIALVDLGGATGVVSIDAYIENLPSISYTKTITNRKWKIVMMSTVIRNLTGNFKPGLDLF